MEYPEIVSGTKLKGNFGNRESLIPQNLSKFSIFEISKKYISIVSIYNFRSRESENQFANFARLLNSSDFIRTNLILIQI